MSLEVENILGYIYSLPEIEETQRKNRTTMEPNEEMDILDFRIFLI